jgi:Arc/MetJ-type ribon-helix-helix transcriptional regulator
MKTQAQERITISMPKSMFELIQREMEEKHFTSVSEWIRGLIREELSQSDYVVSPEDKARRIDQGLTNSSTLMD